MALVFPGEDFSPSADDRESILGNPNFMIGFVDPYLKKRCVKIAE